MDNSGNNSNNNEIITLDNGTTIREMGNGKFRVQQLDGTLFVGTLNDDMSFKEGTATLSNGSVFSGTFRNNRLDGENCYVIGSNGVNYGGFYTDGNIDRNREVTITLRNGDCFKGLVYNNLVPKNGILSRSDGLVLTGTFNKDGALQGHDCSLLTSDGYSIIGIFENGDFDHTQQAVKIDPDGTTFNGLLNEDLTYNNGIATLPDGSVFGGTFVDGMLNGNNCFAKTSEGETYRGTYINGALDLKQNVRITYPNGDSFEGRANKHRMPIVGTKRENGWTYIGQFNMNGNLRDYGGVGISPEGVRTEGDWYNGKFIPTMPFTITHKDNYMFRGQAESSNPNLAKGVLTTPVHGGREFEATITVSDRGLATGKATLIDRENGKTYEINFENGLSNFAELGISNGGIRKTLNGVEVIYNDTGEKRAANIPNQTYGSYKFADGTTIHGYYEPGGAVISNDDYDITYANGETFQGSIYPETLGRRFGKLYRTDGTVINAVFDERGNIGDKVKITNPDESEFRGTFSRGVIDRGEGVYIDPFYGNRFEGTIKNGFPLNGRGSFIMYTLDEHSNPKIDGEIKGSFIDGTLDGFCEEMSLNDGIIIKAFYEKGTRDFNRGCEIENLLEESTFRGIADKDNNFIEGIFTKTDENGIKHIYSGTYLDNRLANGVETIIEKDGSRREIIVGDGKVSAISQINSISAGQQSQNINLNGNNNINSNSNEVEENTFLNSLKNDPDYIEATRCLRYEVKRLPRRQIDNASSELDRAFGGQSVASAMNDMDGRFGSQKKDNARGKTDL